MRHASEMTCKWSRILLMVATLIVLVTGDCIEEVSKAGSYQPIKNPEKDTDVKKIVAYSINLYNKRLPIGYSYVDDDNYVAYSKLLKKAVGPVEYYCCQFRMKSHICNNNDEGGICIPEKRLCSVKGRKKPSAKFPTIYKASLKCTPEYDTRINNPTAT